MCIQRMDMHRFVWDSLASPIEVLYLVGDRVEGEIDMAMMI